MAAASSVLETALRGLGVLGKGAAETAALTKTFKTGGLLSSVGEWYGKNPIRNSMSVGALGASSLMFGTAGIGPFSGLGEEQRRMMISKYGDRPETQKIIDAQQGFAAAGGVIFGLAGGAGLFGRGPLAMDLTKPATVGVESLSKGLEKLAPRSILDSIYRQERFGGLEAGSQAKGLIPNILNASEKIKDIAKTPYSWAKNYKFEGVPRHSHINPKGSFLKRADKAYANVSNKVVKGVSNVKNINKGYLANEDRFYLKKPIRWGLAAGGTAGLAAGVADDERNKELEPFGYEGDIIGITSSQQGGISPELQYSTQGLMFALHRNNRNSRARYH